MDILEDARRPRNFLKTPWPALNEIMRFEPGYKHFAVLALPWGVQREAPFLLAQAAAAQGANPLCVYPSWEPRWDGALSVLRSDDLSPSYEELATLVQKGTEYQLVIVDQFSRLYWDGRPNASTREDAIDAAGKELLGVSLYASIPVLVIVRWKPKPGAALSIHSLRSDGGLEYTADQIVLVQPHPGEERADIHVAKDRDGPSPYTTTVEWSDTRFRTPRPEQA